MRIYHTTTQQFYFPYDSLWPLSLFLFIHTYTKTYNQMNLHRFSCCQINIDSSSFAPINSVIMLPFKFCFRLLISQRMIVLQYMIICVTAILIKMFTNDEKLVQHQISVRSNSSNLSIVEKLIKGFSELHQLLWRRMGY